MSFRREAAFDEHCDPDVLKYSLVCHFVTASTHHMIAASHEIIHLLTTIYYYCYY